MVIDSMTDLVNIEHRHNRYGWMLFTISWFCLVHIVYHNENEAQVLPATPPKPQGLFQDVKLFFQDGFVSWQHSDLEKTADVNKWRDIHLFIGLAKPAPECLNQSGF